MPMIVALFTFLAIVIMSHKKFKGAALIYVGVLMLASIKNVDWNDFKTSVPAFLTISIMPFTYNTSYGIAFGLISYIVISTSCGDFKKIKVSL